MYKQLVRPWLFRIDAERIHGQIVTALHLYRHLSPVRALFRWSFKPKAEVFRWRGLSFGNRVGLSAGFDKEASCFDELADLGFGFLEVGTVTPSEVKGNPCPRIFRLPKDEALFHVRGSTIPEKQSYRAIFNGKGQDVTCWELILIRIVRRMVSGW